MKLYAVIPEQKEKSFDASNLKVYTETEQSPPWDNRKFDAKSFKMATKMANMYNIPVSKRLQLASLRNIHSASTSKGGLREGRVAVAPSCEMLGKDCSDHSKVVTPEPPLRDVPSQKIESSSHRCQQRTRLKNQRRTRTARHCRDDSKSTRKRTRKPKVIWKDGHRAPRKGGKPTPKPAVAPRKKTAKSARRFVRDNGLDLVRTRPSKETKADRTVSKSKQSTSSTALADIFAEHDLFLVSHTMGYQSKKVLPIL